MDRETALEKAKALARAASLETAGIERVIVPRQTMSRLAHWNERPQFPTPTRWGPFVLQNEKPGFWPGDRKHSERDETPTSWISIGTSVGSLCNLES